MVLALVAQPAMARTLAVLPLDKGSGSEEYDGLGKALAGMLISDLSHLEGLEIVERARLDALLAEIELGSGGFVDPDTAQKLGKGLGAEWVVNGSWSVVGTTFLLDARVVDVATSKVIKAADASGSIDDFVTVEKDLIEALIEDLDVEISSGERRKLISEVATENFGAFSAYGEGLAREEEGKFSEAQKAFETAVASDPEFEAAKAALKGLRLALEREKGKDAAKAESAQDRAFAQALQTYPFPSKPKQSHSSGLSVRWWVMGKQGRHCERYDEMTRWLDAVKWDVQPVTVPSKLPAGVGADDGSLWFNTDWFVVHYDDMNPGQKSSAGVIASMLRCHPDASEQLVELDAISASVAKFKRGRVNRDPKTYPGITLQTRIRGVRALIQALHLGVDSALQKELEDLLARFPNPGTDATGHDRFWVMNVADSVTRLGGLWQQNQWYKAGLSDDTLIGVYNEIFGHTTGFIDESGELCKEMMDTKRAQYAAWPQDKVEPHDPTTAFLLLGSEAAPLAMMGCVNGVPAKAKTTRDAVALVLSADKRWLADRDVEACDREWVIVKNMANSTQYLTGGAEIGIVHNTVRRYYTELVFKGCISDP